jgi:uncharacterized RDD family membrane protein YckC
MAEPLDPPRPALPRRLAAMLYDILLVLPLVMMSVAVVMGLRSLLGFGPSAEGIVQLNAHLVQLIAVLTVMVFFSWFWLKNGQTLGMQAWRIKLVGFNGQAPTAKQVVIRCLGALLSAACLGLGFLWCLVDRKRRYWHDYLSSTELVLLPKKGGRESEKAARKD